MGASFRADNLYMKKLFRWFDASIDVLISGLSMYVGYYIGIFLVAPFVGAFDQWSVIPLWLWMLSAVAVDAIWKRVHVPSPVAYDESFSASCVSRARFRPAVRVGRRPRTMSAMNTSALAPLHRQIRFGRTRIR